MSNTRKRLESWVVATNSVLRNVVSTMDPIILLRNCSPAYRADFARELASEGLIKPEQVKEFTIVKKFV